MQLKGVVMASKDYIFKMLAASSHSKDAREEHDFYSTEPSCGNGNIANVLLSHGHEVDAYDLIDRGFGYTKDFLSDNTQIEGDIVMNPPYKYAMEHVSHGMSILKEGGKLCAFLKVQFLESQKRKPLFDAYPLKYMYVFRKRTNSYRNDDRSLGGSAVCYCWYVWEKGYTGEPTIRWID